MAGSFNSDPLLALYCKELSIQAVFTGSSPTGDFKLQGSNDVTMTAASVTNWSDLGTAQSVTASGDILFEVEKKCKWVRLVYTRTSGTGTCNATYYMVEER
jgi:hypothetical protein